MTIKQTFFSAAAVSALWLTPAAWAHADHDMPADMDKMHEALEAKLADTSAFGEKGDPAKASRTVKLTGEEMQYNVDVLSAAVGETVTFELTNEGKKSHELTLGDAAYQETAQEMMEMMTDMGIDPDSPEHVAIHAKAGNTIIVKPGETRSLTWKFTKAGDVLFECNFIGHAEAGMIGTITVK